MPNQISCPECKESITLQTLELGSREHCPHCNSDFVVSYRMIKQARKIAEESEGYELKTAGAAQAPQADLLSGKKAPIEKEDIEEEVEEEAATWRPMRAPPLDLFLKRTFSYPFRSGSRGWFVILLIFSFVIEGSAALSLYFGSFPTSSKDVGAAWFASVLLAAITLILAVIFFITLSAIGVAILRDTSEGLEKLINLPQGMFTDWIEETIYVLVNLFFGGLPAVILFKALPDSPGLKTAIFILSETIFFPIFLLSSLASTSIVIPYSAPVWRSLRYAWHTWVLFYLFTLLSGESLVLLWQINPYKSDWTNALVFSIFLSVFWIIYFRLLGRLALYCSGFYDILHPPKKNLDIVQEEEED